MATEAVGPSGAVVALWRRSPALCLFLVCVAIRIALAWPIAVPYVLTDELLYAKLAQSFAEGRLLWFREAPIAFPSFLYALVLAPARWLSDPLTAYRGIQVINAILFGMAAVALYFVARRVVGDKLALPAAALALLPPYGLQFATAMSESLFFPLVCWATYCLLECAERREARWRFGLAAALGLACLTKPHGMTILPLAFGLTWLAMRLLPAASPPHPLAVHRPPAWPGWLAVPCYLAFAYIDMAVVGQATGAGASFDLGRLFGTYAEGLTGRRPLAAGAFLGAAAANFSALALAVGFLPLALFPWYAVRALRTGARSDQALAIWIALLGGALIALTARHTVTIDDTTRIHERYCFYVEPLIILCAVRVASGLRDRALAAAGILAAAWAALSLGFVSGALRTPIVADSLSYSALRPIVEVLGMNAALLATFAVVVGALAMAVLALAMGETRFAGRLLAAYLAGLTGLALVSQTFASRHSASRLPVARWVIAKVPADRHLAIISSAELLPAQLLVEFMVRNPVHLYYDGVPQHHMNDRPIALAGTELTGLAGLPDGTAVLTHRSGGLALPLLGESGDLALYEKRGTVRRTQEITGVFPDGWTSGKTRIRETRFGPGIRTATMRLRIDTSSIPASLSPFVLGVRDGTGRRSAHDLPLGVVSEVALEVDRVPGAPFDLELTSPTWSPAAAYGSGDARQLGFGFRGALFEPHRAAERQGPTARSPGSAVPGP
jgi:hypothetical protein